MSLFQVYIPTEARVVLIYLSLVFFFPVLELLGFELCHGSAILSFSPKSLQWDFSPSTSTCSLSKLLAHHHLLIMTSLLSALPNIPSLRKQQLYLEL